MELLEGIGTRKSFRAFKSTSVPEEVMRSILEAARKSPSYTNTQPWEVAVVSGKKKEELSKILHGLAKSGTAPNPDLPLPTTWPPELEKRAREHRMKRLQFLGIDINDERQREESRLLNFEFYGAPCVLFTFMDSTLTAWSIFDMGIFAQSIILAAHSFGVGSCLQAMLAIYPDVVREFLGIPKTKRLILGISMGYPNLKARVNAYQSERVDLDNFTKWYT